MDTPVIDPVMSLFHEMASQSQPLTLLNTYRGIPINFPAQIIYVEQGYVAVKVVAYQAASLALDGSTFVQGELLPVTYHARAVTVNVVDREAILTEFTPAGDSIGKRSHIRVQPGEPVDTVIWAGDQSTIGKLADISSFGLGVYTFATYFYGDIHFKKGQEISIEFNLPGSAKATVFQGTVTGILHQSATFLSRVGVQIKPEIAECRPGRIRFQPAERNLKRARAGLRYHVQGKEIDPGMALDFQQVHEQVIQLGEKAPQREQHLRNLREQARQSLAQYARQWMVLRQRVETAVKQDANLRCALPLVSTSSEPEPLDQVLGCPHAISGKHPGGRRLTNCPGPAC